MTVNLQVFLVPFQVALGILIAGAVQSFFGIPPIFVLAIIVLLFGIRLTRK